MFIFVNLNIILAVYILVWNNYNCGVFQINVHQGCNYLIINAVKTVILFLPHNDKLRLIASKINICVNIFDPLCENPAKVDFFVIYCFLHNIILHKLKNIL